MTRKGLLILFKSRILTKLFNFSLFKSCDLDHWDSDDPIPREELLKRVSGLDGLYCLLTEKIDAELLDVAGEWLIMLSFQGIHYKGPPVTFIFCISFITNYYHLKISGSF